MSRAGRQLAHRGESLALAQARGEVALGGHVSIVNDHARVGGNIRRPKAGELEDRAVEVLHLRPELRGSTLIQGTAGARRVAIRQKLVAELSGHLSNVHPD